MSLWDALQVPELYSYTVLVSKEQLALGRVSQGLYTSILLEFCDAVSCCTGHSKIAVQACHLPQLDCPGRRRHLAVERESVGARLAIVLACIDAHPGHANCSTSCFYKMVSLAWINISAQRSNDFPRSNATSSMLFDCFGPLLSSPWHVLRR